MKTRPLVALGAVALVALTLYAATINHAVESAPPKSTTEPNMFPFVRSLDGTDPPEVTVSGADVLVADAELRHMFDYYLSAGAETSPDKIREKIEAELDHTLKPAAASEAKRLSARYLNYRNAVMDLQKNPPRADPGVSPIHARLLAIQQIRARFFTPKEVTGMFGFDDANDADTIARLDINQDKSLSLAQKKAKLDALDAAMPPALREAREAPLKVAKMEESVLKMRADGASEDEIYRMRAKEFSPEAAARLADLDRETLDWKKRIADYQSQRQSLLANTALGDADRQAAIQQIRDARFSTDEQKRLPAYE
jgi:lipase chaperone LimK